MDNDIKVSLVTVTYNNYGIIKKSLQSFITFLNDYLDEIIIFDNASTDKTIDEIDNKDSRIRIIKSEQNLGYRKAINILLKLAKNEIVIVTNPDIYLIDNSIINIVKIMMNDKKIAIGNPIPITQKNLMFKELLPCILYKRISSSKLIKSDKRIVESSIGGGSIFIIRKNIFNEIGGFSENCFMFGEEIEMSYKVLQKGYKIIWDTHSQVIHDYSYSIRRVRDKKLINKLKYSFYCSLINCYKLSYNNKNSIYKFSFFIFYFSLAIIRSIYKLSIRDFIASIKVLLDNQYSRKYNASLY